MFRCTKSLVQMLSVILISVFTPHTHVVGKNYKMVVSCFAFGSANRFGALQGHFKRISNILEARRKQWTLPVKCQSWALSKYWREYTATIFYQEGELSKARANSRFQPCVVDTKVALHQHL